MLIMNRRSHVIRHMLTLRIFDTSKKLCFWQNREEVFNWLNSTNWVSCTKAMCRGHVQGVCKLPGVICIYKWAEFNGTDSLRVKGRCQLVVRLKANKCYQGLIYYLSSYINLLNLLNLQSLCGRLLTPGQFQTSSPWSRPLTVLVLILVFSQLFLGKVCRNPTALRWVVCFVAIQPLLDKLLVLGRLVSRSQSVDRWFNQTMLSILLLQSFSRAVQDGIIPLNNHAFILDLYQDHLRISRDHLDKPLDLFVLRLLPASTVLQGSFAGVTAVIRL